MNLQVLGEINEAIKNFIGVQEVIFADQKGKKPKYPYITVKNIAESKTGGMGIYTYEPIASDNSEFELDLEERKFEMPLNTLSINSYSKDMDEAYEAAQKCKDWFEFHGYDYLKEKGIVVVETTTIENRDSLVAVDYERRWGFDVILRSSRTISKRVETVEKIIINNKELGE